MKKNLILAVAAVLAVGQVAVAGPGKGDKDKPEGARAEGARESKKTAEESVKKGADASHGSAFKAASDAKLTSRLSPKQAENLKNPAFASIIAEIVQQSKNNDFFALAQARLEALSNIPADAIGKSVDAISAMTPDAKAQQAYITLAVEAGQAAQGWSKDLRANLTFLLEKANDLVASGKSVTDAMKEAIEILAKPEAQGGRGVKLKVDDVNKFCKK